MLLNWLHDLPQLSLLALGMYALHFLVLVLATHRMCLKHDDQRYEIYRLYRKIHERFNGYKYLISGISMVESLYRSSNGRPFSIQGPERLNIMVSSQKHIQELDQAPRHVLSLHAVAKEFFQPKHTMNGFDWHDQRGLESTNFVRALRHLRAPRLRLLIPNISSIIHDQVQREIMKARVTSGWSFLPLFAAVQRVVIWTNCAMFFPPELASNAEFVEAALKSTHDVFLGAEIIRMLPSAIAPFVERLATHNHRATNTMFNFLHAVVAERMERFKDVTTETGPEEQPDDCIQWMIKATLGSQSWTAERVVQELMATFYGSFSVAFAATYALIDLYSHPEYIEYLREEVSGPLFDAFRESSEGLPELDAFLKESARLGAFDSPIARRQALEDFWFSDGLCVPKGSWVGIPHREMMRDELYFDQADQFDGRRFLKSGGWNKSVEEAKLSSASHSWLVWGTKRITCPGRFYAVVVLKLVVAEMIKNYDCELEPFQGSRSSEWRGVLVPKSSINLRVKAVS